ncbi:MAG: hypothetical protein II458_09110 [Oscillospiraceae bacterium]|nr:hypothetical protein [Oscillospiraceae bacterium]
MNMRNLRIAIVIFFCVVAVLFTGAYIRERLTTDYGAPVIQADTDTLRVSVSATEEDLLAGMTAYDNLDGDVTDTLVVMSRSKFISKGTIRVNYAAFDNSRNVGTYSREVIFTDYVSPHFRMDAPLRFASAGSMPDYLEHITAQDCLDGDITRQIKLTTGRSFAVSDSVTRQKVNLHVTNSCGDNAVLELTVSMEDYSSLNRPAPALRDYVLYAKKGGSLSLWNNVTGIWIGGNMRTFTDTGFSIADISVDDSAVNYAVPGVYTAVYTLSSDGVDLGIAELIVVVEG